MKEKTHCIPSAFSPSSIPTFFADASTRHDHSTHHPGHRRRSSTRVYRRPCRSPRARTCVPAPATCPSSAARTRARREATSALPASSASS
eukprot:2938587-Rhodomonas_salina.1